MNRSLSFLGFVLKYIRVSDIHAHAHTKLPTFWILEISIFVDKAKKDTFNWIIICCVVVFVCVCSLRSVLPLRVRVFCTKLFIRMCWSDPFEKWEDIFVWCGVNVCICCANGVFIITYHMDISEKMINMICRQHGYYQTISGRIWNTICTSFHTNELEHTQIPTKSDQFKSFKNENTIDKDRCRDRQKDPRGTKKIMISQMLQIHS